MRISDGSSDGCSSDLWTSCFMVLFALVGVALAWMHIAIRQMEQKASGIAARSLPQFPEMAGLHDETRHAAAQPSTVLAEWKPEDPEIGRASCRERGGQYVYISVASDTFTKKKP